MINIFLREGGGTPDKRIPEDLFLNVFRETSRFNFYQSKQSSVNVFGVFGDCSFAKATLVVLFGALLIS